MYHLEFRKFPHTVCRFNQSEEQLRSILIPWARGEWVEQGERKWNLNEATLTVLEGPRLAMPELAMGRGWRNAQRRSEDVTERVLADARGAGGGVAAPAAPDAAVAAQGAAPQGAAPQGAATQAPPVAGPVAERELLADSLGLELLALLDDGALPPARVWQVARIRLVGGSAADALALAERALRSLLRRGLVVVRQAEAPGAELTGEQLEAALAGAETWGGGDSGARLVIARKG